MQALDSSSKGAAFRKLVDDIRKETENLSLPETIEHVIARSGLVEHYKAEREGQERIENLGELVNAAAGFSDEARTSESGEETSALTAFLTHAALEAGEHQAAEGQDALQLMTVHSAKGLEFDAVFLTGLEEGLFPHEQSALEKDGLEEERRLAYVALTRARKRLYLSFAQTRMLHGQTRYSLASRFLEEIPEGLKKWLTPRFSRQRDFSWSAPAKKEKPFQVKSIAGFRIGQNVVHPKFGSGVIVDLEGQGADVRVQVNFRDHGLKLLALAVAKLQAA